MEREKVLIYYTCLTHDDVIEQLCRKQLLEANLPIVSVSRNEPIDFGENHVITGERSPETMHRQVLEGLKHANAKYVFLCESDVLYPPSHFDFIPEEEGVFYYETNVWKYHTDMEKYTWTDDLQQVSGSAAYTKDYLRFYERRVKEIEESGFDRHYEAGSKTGEIAMNWRGADPMICIRHENTITKTKKSPDDFINKSNANGWTELYSIPKWDYLTNLL